MANVQMTLLSERWLDQVLFLGTQANIGADASDGYLLPAGVGDVAFIEGLIIMSGIATMVATPENLGCEWTIRNQAASIVDIIGVSRWQKNAADRMSSYVSPDPLVLWRQTESLFIVAPELDTNVSPTGDYLVVAKAVRVNPIQAPAGPIQLVR